MRHLPHSVDYSKADDLIDELDNLSFDEVKKIMRDIIEDNGNLLKVSERAAIALDQYKELVSLVDGIIIDDVMDDEVSFKEKAKNSIAEIFLRLIFSMKNTSYWLMILSDLMEKYASKDKGLHNLISILKKMSKGILAASRQLKYKHPTKRKKSSFLRNLERPKEKNGGRKLEKRVSTSSPVNLSENEDSDNRNAVQNESEMMDEEPDESISVNNETLEEEDAKSEDEQGQAASDNAFTSEVEVEKSDEELEETTVEPSADASESDTNEGEKDATDRITQELQKKKEKTFGISYFKTENLFRNGVVESNKTYQSISKRRNKTSPSSALHRKRNSFKSNVNKNSQSSNTSRNSLDESENNHLHSDSETVSKGPRRYSRKRTLSSKEEDTNVNGLGQSENDTLESVPKRHRRSNSSSNRGYVSESESKGRRKSRKDSFNVESGSATKSSISSEQPKKRGRRRKMDIMQQKMMENGDRNDYALKYACVHLSNVLDDPSVQHYADIIQMSHRKKKENTKMKEKQKKSRDKGEADENSLGKETNEGEVEWNVLDAVSDEEEKDNNNDQESGKEVNSDNDEQVSESEADQEQAVDDNDQEQPDDEELETNSVETKQTDERCDSAGQDEGSNHSETKQCTESSSNHPSVSSSHEESDSERKHHKSSPLTPSSHHISSPEVFHTEDENDAEAESVRSDEEEEEGERAPSSSSEPSKHGRGIMKRLENNTKDF